MDERGAGRPACDREVRAVNAVDPVGLASALIAAPSVTPARGEVFDVLVAALAPLGFEIDRFVVEDVENLLATRSGSGCAFAFAGHLDVVPPGSGWTSDPFEPVVRGNLLYGRGAVDMKGSIAAFVAACARVREAQTMLIITGDEEGPATHGTLALIERMAARDIRPDMILVGEPTSSARLGDTIKIGRRGSVNIWIEVAGTQGHVAYPQLADNPVAPLVRILAEIEAVELDGGTDWFQPSNIEITTIDVGNPTHNLIPASASARLSIRFNDRHTGAALIERIAAIAARHSARATVTGVISGEAFLTPPGALSTLVADAVREVTGTEAELSTSGGTSDGRFLSKLCPTVELGLVNATMHKLDEAVALADLRDLAEIYAGVLRRAMR